MPTSEEMTEGAVTGSSAINSLGRLESLSCVGCRIRKLRCDRAKPVCCRCAKVSAECVYPESRRKPAFKRKNVRELEARIAHVEGLLKDAGKRPAFAAAPVAHGKASEDQVPSSDPSGAQDTGTMWVGGGFDYDTAFAKCPGNYAQTPPDNVNARKPPFAPIIPEESPGGGVGFSGGELYRLGHFETLPPREMIEELHAIYFSTHHPTIPIIHQGRYLHSFYSVPHMRPPMGLQYAIWTMAAAGHKKYGAYHEVFYRRARQYLEHDELKGNGEHFLTVRHAQAWALVSTHEARSMLFTRCSMSSSRCTRLATMMGLHRLDDPSDAAERLMVPTIGPPQDWTELEERRRTLWVAFCIDSHASISTGWPNAFDVNEITTHLPASEEAFNSGTPESACSLHDVFKGATYPIFAGVVIICHLFKEILKHVHRPAADDEPENVDGGKFWARHRSLDNTLAKAFMFLPEPFRLPTHIRNPIAVHMNLNLHASVICLHQAACDKADKYKLPAHIRQVSLDRMVTTAQEIVIIMKLTARINMAGAYRSPLVALSLYCAASVYVYQATQQSPGRTFDTSNLEFLINCMEAIGRDHVITRSYLSQAIRDIKQNGLSDIFDVSKWEDLPPSTGHNVPLLARSSVCRHTKLQTPLPAPFFRAEFGHVIGEEPEEEDDETPGPKQKNTANFATAEGTDPLSSATVQNVMPHLSPSSSRAVGTTSLWPSNLSSATFTTTHSQAGGAIPSPALPWPHLPDRHLPHRASGSSPAVSSSSPTTGGSGSMGYPTPGLFYTPGATGCGEDMGKQPQMGLWAQQQNVGDMFPGALGPQQQQWVMDPVVEDGVYAQFFQQQNLSGVGTGGFGAPDNDLWTDLGAVDGRRDGIGDGWNGSG